MIETNYEDFLEILESKAIDHIAYYHYTRWENLAKMLTPVANGPAAGHRVLHLTRASETNDGIESHWARNVYMACFSLSRYEDVAMWLNYGRHASDAVRVKFGEDPVRNWLKDRHNVYAVGADTGLPEADISTKVKSVKLYGVAYVIPSKHWVDFCDQIGVVGDCQIVQNGNIELGRDFYRVQRDGRYDWVDDIYYGNGVIDHVPPVFKKRGWAYEREIRLVVELSEAIKNVKIAVSFDKPLDDLARNMPKLATVSGRHELWGGRRTSKIELGDVRFPLIQSGPWFKPDARREKICGLSLDKAIPSEYTNEIKIFV